MSTPGHPLHPESIPPRIAYSPGHRQWLDENRVKRHRKDRLETLLKSLMNRKVWWSIVKVLATPVITASIVAWIITNIMAPNVTLTVVLETYLFGGSIATCVAFSVYVDLWNAKIKTRSDRILIQALGITSGALIGLTCVLISLIPA